MEAFIVREGEMVVLNAHNHAFADEVQKAVVQLQAFEDDAYQDVIAPMHSRLKGRMLHNPLLKLKEV